AAGTAVQQEGDRLLDHARPVGHERGALDVKEQLGVAHFGPHASTSTSEIAPASPHPQPLPPYRGVHWTPDLRSHGASVLRTSPRPPYHGASVLRTSPRPRCDGRGETDWRVPSPAKRKGLGGGGR